jgi:adenylate cyclase
MEAMDVYLPMDRRQALVRGEPLPERTWGSAIFADISGFTQLTDVLVQGLGPQRGAEELTRFLNMVYDKLIAELHKQGGCVIGFSGDAITCWLDGDDGRRAAACALAMQQAMNSYASLTILPGQTLSLAMKVVVASGPARRFLVGIPDIQVIEAISGETFDRLAAAEHRAQKREILLDRQSAAALGEAATIREWRFDTQSGLSFAVLERLNLVVDPKPWPPLPPDALREEQVRPWVLPAVCERLRQGQGEFLAEIRPAASLFLRFHGIDFESDRAAGEKLNRMICQVQKTVSQYEGTLLQLTIGDKGSYLYAAFGAPVAHEDDSARAVIAALELREALPGLNCLESFCMGISQGQMRTGAYGGSMRRTYGVLGDNANLAARLMQASAAGEILVSQIVQQSAGSRFIWKDHPLLYVKGKSEPVVVFSLDGVRGHRFSGFQVPRYELPMVGREAEKRLAAQKLDQALAGRGQVLGIRGEAGIGKSRLVAEIVQLAHLQEVNVYAGESQSYGTHISYQVWQGIWTTLFGLDPLWSPLEKKQAIEQQLAEIDPLLVPRAPLLGSLLNISIPDNELTGSFDAKLRKSSLESLLVDCLRAWARRSPMVLVLENCHWMDLLSQDLLDAIRRTIVDLPVLLVMTYRIQETPHSRQLELLQLPYFTAIDLEAFTFQDAQRLIHSKLEQFSASPDQVPDSLVQYIIERAEGNPFYIEELVNYLLEQEHNFRFDGSLEQVNLPSSLHSLILSRIDQRTESQKITLKLSSIIGRIVTAAWLWGAFPQLGDEQQVRSDLRELIHAELMALNPREPELTYLFKQLVTREVAYDSLPFATRAILHEQLAAYIERISQDLPEQSLELLAYHYERSQNLDKKREYLLKAAKAAQGRYANQAAIDYYRRVLPILPDTEKVGVMHRLGQSLALVGNWQEAEKVYQQVLQLSTELGDRKTLAWCQTSLAELSHKQGLYAEAADWLERARLIFEEDGNMVGLGQVLHYGGTQAAQQGKFDESRLLYQRSLKIRRELNDQVNISSLLSNLGIISRLKGDRQSARALQEEALAIRRQLGDKSAIAVSLNNLGNLALDQGDYNEAQERLEEAVGLQREVGDRFYIANALNNLANVARDQGRLEVAKSHYKESLEINRELGAKWAVAYLLEDIGGLMARQGQARTALRLVGAAATLRQEIGARLSEREQSKLDQMLATARQSLGVSEQKSAYAEGASNRWEEAAEEALLALS